MTRRVLRKLGLFLAVWLVLGALAARFSWALGYALICAMVALVVAWTIATEAPR